MPAQAQKSDHSTLPGAASWQATSRSSSYFCSFSATQASRVSLRYASHPSARSLFEMEIDTPNAANSYRNRAHFPPSTTFRTSKLCAIRTLDGRFPALFLCGFLGVTCDVPHFFSSTKTQKTTHTPSSCVGAVVVNAIHQTGALLFFFC